MKSEKRDWIPLPLLLCLQVSAWCAGFSKPEVLETQVRGLRDSVYIRNDRGHPFIVGAIEVNLEESRFGNWEIQFRTMSSNGEKREICLGKGFGSCEPIEHTGGARSGRPLLSIPAGDSLLLHDFNLAACIRCPLPQNGTLGNAPGGVSISPVEDSLRVPIILIGMESGRKTRDTLSLIARLAKSTPGRNQR